jgi:hypothetical protein
MRPTVKTRVSLATTREGLTRRTVLSDGWCYTLRIHLGCLVESRFDLFYSFVLSRQFLPSPCRTARTRSAPRNVVFPALSRPMISTEYCTVEGGTKVSKPHFSRKEEREKQRTSCFCVRCATKPDTSLYILLQVRPVRLLCREGVRVMRKRREDTGQRVGLSWFALV